jgi:hypothetical protein
VQKSIIELVVVLLCCASAYSQQTQRGQTSGIREIIPGHYMFSCPNFPGPSAVTPPQPC